MKLSSISHGIVDFQVADPLPAFNDRQVDATPAGQRLLIPPPLTDRPSAEAIVAQRLRRQCTRQATRAFNRSAHGIQAPLVEQDESDVGGTGARNRDAAADAKRMVELALYVPRPEACTKSMNKWHPRHATWRADDADPIELRVSTQTITGNDPAATAARSIDIWRSRSLNCGALAAAAQDYLMHDQPKLQTSCVVVGKVHAFAAVGTVDESVARLPLAQWPRHIHVCDVWANLTCSAPDYPHRFLEKMAKWDLEGKKIAFEMKWISPRDEHWTSCVESVPDIYVRRHYRDGQFLEVPIPASVDSEQIVAAALAPMSDRCINAGRRGLTRRTLR